jgi:hypothetical protein
VANSELLFKIYLFKTACVYGAPNGVLNKQLQHCFLAVRVLRAAVTTTDTKKNNGRYIYFYWPGSRIVHRSTQWALGLC